MSDCPEARSTQRIVALLAIAGIDAARISQSTRDLEVSEDFFNSLEAIGPWAHVNDVEVGESEWQGFYDYKIPISVYYGYKKGETGNTTDFQNQNYEIRRALNRDTNWSPTVSNVGTQPYNISSKPCTEDTENLPVMCAMYQITASFRAAYEA